MLTLSSPNGPHDQRHKTVAERKACPVDVIIHIGAHRTASTALQHHLATHRDIVAEGGGVYWGPKVTRGGLFRGAIGGLEPALAWQRRRFNGRCAMRADAVRQTGATHLIISDENMLGSLRATLEDTILYRDAGRRISAHAEGFARHRVTVGICVRSYVDWWTSAMAFRLSRGGPLPRVNLREHLVTQPRRWRHIIEEIARVLPDATVMVWTYEALGHQPDRILHDLCGIATPPASDIRQNARPSADKLRQQMAEFGIDPQEFHWPDGQFMPFTAHEAEALNAQYAEDLAWLAAGAGGLADFIDAPAVQISNETAEQTADGRGTDHGGETRYLA